MPPKRRKQKGKGLGSAIRKVASGIKSGAQWVYRNRAGIKQVHDYAKENKLVSRGLAAVGRADDAKKAEQAGYGQGGCGCGCQGGAGLSAKMKFCR